MYDYECPAGYPHMCDCEIERQILESALSEAEDAFYQLLDDYHHLKQEFDLLKESLDDIGIIYPTDL